MNKFLAGAAAGTLATVPMTLTMVWLHRQIPKTVRRELPPERITMNIADELGLERVLDEEAEQKEVSLVNHFAYGAAAGALYATIAESADFPPAGERRRFWIGGVDGKLSRLAARSPEARFRRPSSRQDKTL